MTARRSRLWLRRLALCALILFLSPFAIVVVYAFFNPPVTVLQISKALEGNSITASWTNIGAVSRNLSTAVVVAEDSRFCEHHGVDWEMVHRVFRDKLERPEKKARGASTITMQIAKNLFFTPDRSILRKAMEVPLALWIDFVWSKRRQLEVYMNIVEWAPGIYGAEAAARHHFGKSAKKLTRREAVRLAASLPNPKIRNAGVPGPFTRRIARRIDRRARSNAANLNCLRTD